MSGYLLDHLSLLFVPAGVGIMAHLSLLGEEWLPLSITLVISTALTLVASGLMVSWFSRHRRETEDE